MSANTTLLSWLAGSLAIVGLVASQTAWSASARESLVEQNLAPVAAVNVAGAAAAQANASPAAPDGEAIYSKVCVACHSAGVSGAPIVGDKASWAPRIKLGEAALVKTAISGIKAMPPKGGCMSCSDDEIKAAVDYMIKKSS